MRRRSPSPALPLLVALVACVGLLLVARSGPWAGTVDADTATAADGAATGLHPGLATAMERATAAAAADGRHLRVTSGHRTAEEQAALLREAVVEHGSREAAERWVFPPDRSMHVRGLAVDVGDGPAAEWLDAHGDRFGLCRTLAWEWWHFEWRSAWEVARRCPAPATEVDAAPSAG